MHKYAEITDNIITNIFLADDDFVMNHKPDAILCPDEFGVGDKYEDGVFVRTTTSIPVNYDESVS